MAKRPLVWMLGAYLLGVGSAWRQIAIGILLALVILAYIFIYLDMLYHKEKSIHKKQVLFWLLPAFLLLGYVVMQDQSRLPKLYYAFEQEVPCVLTGRIKMVVRKQQGQILYVVNNQIAIGNGENYPCESVIIYLSNDQIYRIGNQITVQGSLQKFQKPTNPGQFNEENYYKALNIDFKLMAEQIIVSDDGYSYYAAFLDQVKKSLMQVYHDSLNNREAGTLTAMLLGEKYLIEDEVKQLYQENGISHILAISGLHVSLIGMSTFWLLRKCRLSLHAATLITVLVIYSYGVMTNFSVSTNRAVVMLMVLLFATLAGKTYDMISAAALSALLILLQNPFQLISTGFLLSFLAVIGIAVLLPILKQLFPGNNKIKNGLLISFSAMLTTSPIILYFFYQYPLYGVITNLMILPFVSVLTMNSILAGFLGMVSDQAGVFAIGGSNYILKLYDLICEGVRHLPFHMITVGKPKQFIIILSFLCMLSFILAAKKYKKKWTLLLLLASQLILFSPHYNPGLEVTLLDVGQGDAIFMENREGTSFLIDGGSSSTGQVGKYRIVPFLKSKGVDRLDYAIITHPDRDHISGIVEMVKENEFTIETLLLPDLADKDEKYMELVDLASIKNINLQYIAAGDRIQEGLLHIDCLHPSTGFIGSTANSYSTVLRVNYGGFDMLLTGDLEAEGEKKLIEELKEVRLQKEFGTAPAIDYEVLKVAHHGSKYSTGEELLKLIKPDYSVISCSKENRYGHPHVELLERLDAVSSIALITYKSGAITLSTDGEMLEISEFRKMGHGVRSQMKIQDEVTDEDTDEDTR